MLRGRVGTRLAVVMVAALVVFLMAANWLFIDPAQEGTIYASPSAEECLILLCKVHLSEQEFRYKWTHVMVGAGGAAVGALGVGGWLVWHGRRSREPRNVRGRVGNRLLTLVMVAALVVLLTAALGLFMDPVHDTSKIYCPHPSSEGPQYLCDPWLLEQTFRYKWTYVMVGAGGAAIGALAVGGWIVWHGRRSREPRTVI